MTDQGNDLKRDIELGTALSAALEMPHHGAFVTRMKALARRAARPRTWDEVLAGWFWQGVLTTSVVLAVVLIGLNSSDRDATPPAGEESVAVQLIDAQRPGADVILASMTGAR
jgi:anti-sigma-K factor RskA